jgi:hypothetical protein
MRPLLFFFFLFIFLACCNPPAGAQQRVHRPAALWPEIQLDYAFPSGSFLYFRNHYRHVLDPDFNLLRRKGPLQHLERLQFRLGYEHVFNPTWSAGFSESYALERSRNIWFHEVYGRHVSTIGKFRFSQRLSFEHLMRRPKQDNGRFRLRADVNRSVELGQLLLRPRVSYEVFFNIDYQPEAHAGQATRLVDRSRLRLDCQIIFNDVVALTPYFIRQSDYFVVEPAFDADNNIIRPGGKQNHLSPIWGLEFRYTVFADRQSFPRHLPLNK